MSDEPPGFNAPRRKGRFNSRYGGEEYRPFSLPKRRPAGPESPSAREPEQTDAAQEPELLAEGVAPISNNPAFEDPAIEAGDKAAATEGDGTLPNFRLNKVYEACPPRSNVLRDGRWLGITTLLLVGGLGVGYLVGRAGAPASPASLAAKTAAKGNLNPLSDEIQAAVDAAFSATKDTHYKEARGQFIALQAQHPEWWSMGIEAARAALYLHDGPETQRSLQALGTQAAALPDADFLAGLLHLTNKELDQAEASFASAVARDPARPDFFYFWGECLRRDGKPRQAADKFRAALIRNQYENAEGLYQTKFWLSVIQADQEAASGVNKEVDAALAAPRPSYEALFAAAARELKAKRYPEAAGFLTRAQAITEPAVFKVILQDPTFSEEGAHPEIAPFFK